jgi:signal transduction histidine kinase
MLPLELRSTFLFSGLIGGIFALAIFMLWHRDRHRYLSAWSGGLAALALCQIVVAWRGWIPDSISIVISNAALTLGSILVYLGTSLFFACRPAIRLSAAIFIGSTALLGYFTLVEPDVGARVLILTTVQTVFLGLHFVLFFGPGWRRQFATNAVAVLSIGVLLCMMIARSLWVLTIPAGADFQLAATGPHAAILVLSLAGAGVALGLWNMHAVRLIETVRLGEARLAEANESLLKLTVRLEMRNQEYAVARDLAETASRSKSQFLANMSHELRTPLNAIIGFSGIIHDGLLGPVGNPAYREYAADINQSGLHLLQLVTDILDMSRADAGNLALNEEVCDPVSVIESSLTMVRSRARQGQVDLALVPAGDTPWLWADERRLRQILVNLLSNAVKFTLPGGRVTVGLMPAPEGALDFMVEDTGIGMSEADIAVALTPFGQVDSQLNRKYEGTGLGLPLTRQLLDLHDADLTIASEIGRGTRVTARFPPNRTRMRSA